MKDDKKHRNPKTKLLLLLVVGITTLMGIISMIIYFVSSDEPAVNEISKFEIVSPDESYVGPFKLLEAGFTDIKIIDETSAILAAKEATQMLELGNSADELTVKSINGVDGVTYYRLQQNYYGIPVMGKTMTVAAGDNGEALGFGTNAVPANIINFGDFITEEMVINNLITYLSDREVDIETNSFTIDELDEAKKAYLETERGIIPVYILSLFWGDSVNSFDTVTVNAVLGEIISIDSTVYEAAATVYNSDKSVSAEGYYAEVVEDENEKYQLIDTERKTYIFSYENTDSQGKNENKGKMTLITSSNEVFGDNKEEKELEQDKAVKLLRNYSDVYEFFNKNMGYINEQKNLVCYNDGNSNGKNAFGGSANYKGEKVPYITMGSVTGVECLDIIAHEYTHTVTKNLVEWENYNKNMPYPRESSAINEGYSDIFGVIIEGQIKGNEQQPDWTIDMFNKVQRNIKNPSESGSPAAVGDMTYEDTLYEKDGIQKSSYAHRFSTIVSHCAYLMNQGNNASSNPISINDLSRLWFNTLYILPSDCTFIALREYMLLTANVLNFSEDQKNRISWAFDEVKIRSQEAVMNTYSTSATMFIEDIAGNPYRNCSVIFVEAGDNVIDGDDILYPYRAAENKIEISVDDRECVQLNLPEGDYVVYIKDQDGNLNLADKEAIRFRSDALIKQIVIKTELLDRTAQIEKDIVLLFDTSESMEGEPLSEAKKAAISFIDMLNTNSRISFVTFGYETIIRVGLTSDKTILREAVSKTATMGGTGMWPALNSARTILRESNAKEKIVILMSDGIPTDKEIIVDPNGESEVYISNDEFINYADEIKREGISIYTLAFYENYYNDPNELGYLLYGQELMRGLANDGYYYITEQANDLIHCFEDIAEQINGQRYVYLSISGPVDVKITWDDEYLCSSIEDLRDRAEFGTLSFEMNMGDLKYGINNRTKVFRLKEGNPYNIEIIGTDSGTMNYSIEFADDNGDYNDKRKFEYDRISIRTKIETTAKVNEDSVLKISEDGINEKVFYTHTCEEENKDDTIIATIVIVSIFVLVFVAVFYSRRILKKYMMISKHFS